VNFGSNLSLPADLKPIVSRRLREVSPQTPTQDLSVMFSRRRAEEAAARGRAPVFIEELKTSQMNDRALAFHEWTEAALWRIDVTINAGDNGCANVPAGRTCWHYGTFPELTRISRGAPIDPQPATTHCQSGSAVACLWVRRWQNAVIVVNETSGPLTVPITTGQPTCRHLVDAWVAEPIAGGACVMGPVTVSIPAETGRVYTEQP
jgi:hypothetical protein